MSDTRDALLVARNSEGKLIQRPLSPHLQVYRPQISTILSISHRITGIALCVGTVLMTWWLMASAGSVSAYETMQNFVGSWLGLLMLFGWTAALWYHFLAGIRHLFWDAGFGYDLKTFHTSGWSVIAGTVAVTLLSWGAGLAIWHGAR